MTTTTERWHWVKWTVGGEFEPACVVYDDGRPVSVWFTGNDFSVDPEDCEIAEEIVRQAPKA